MEAVKIKRATVIGFQGGGSKDVAPGDVLTVGKGRTDLPEEDARYLVATGKAEECDRSEKKKAKE